MPSKRIKEQVVPVPQENELAEIAKEVAIATSQTKKMEAEMEQKIAKIRETYQDRLDEAASTIKEGTAKLKAYATDHKLEFEKKRSRDVVHGTLGFRIGTPKVKVGRGLNKTIVGILKQAGKLDFLRTKEELDKDKVIAHRDDEAIMDDLNELGITVVQEETFYFEPKTEEVTA
jgi:phage host-nuclease inhibitor protein Gam